MITPFNKLQSLKSFNMLKKQLLKLFRRKFILTDILLFLIYMRSFTRRGHKLACLYSLPWSTERTHLIIIFSPETQELNLLKNLFQKKYPIVICMQLNSSTSSFTMAVTMWIFPRGSTVSMKWTIIWLLTLNGIQCPSYGKKSSLHTLFIIIYHCT